MGGIHYLFSLALPEAIVLMLAGYLQKMSYRSLARIIISHRWCFHTLQINGGAKFGTSVDRIAAELLLDTQDLVKLGETL
jgi:hypothetical protein